MHSFLNKIIRCKTCIYFCVQLRVHLLSCHYDGQMATQKVYKAMSESVQSFLNHIVSQGIIAHNKGSVRDDDSPEEDTVILSLT